MAKIVRFRDAKIYKINLHLFSLYTDMVCLRQATVKVEQDEDVSEEAKKKRRVE